MKTLTTALAAALLASVATTPVLAADITIRNFAGIVEIVEGPTELTVLSQGEKGDLNHAVSDGEITIDGGLDSKARNSVCKGNGGLGWDLSIGNWKSKGNSRLEDYPHLEIRMPAGSNLDIEDVRLQLTSEVPLGTAQLDIGGCFDTALADVDILIVEKSGSGDLSVGNVNRFDIEKSGAGDIEAATVDVFDLEQSGAGDVEIDSLTGRATIDKSGAGDIEIDRADGDVTIEKSGAGDVDISSGEIPNLSIQSSGAGDVEIDAAVGNAFVRASGAGDVYLDSVSGTLDQRTSGAADFTRGDE